MKKDPFAMETLLKQPKATKPKKKLATPSTPGKTPAAAKRRRATAKKSTLARKKR